MSEQDHAWDCAVCGEPSKPGWHEPCPKSPRGFSDRTVRCLEHGKPEDHAWDCAVCGEPSKPGWHEPCPKSPRGFSDRTVRCLEHGKPVKDAVTTRTIKPAQPVSRAQERRETYLRREFKGQCYAVNLDYDLFCESEREHRGWHRAIVPETGEVVEWPSLTDMDSRFGEFGRRRDAPKPKPWWEGWKPTEWKPRPKVVKDDDLNALIKDEAKASDDAIRERIDRGDV